LPNTRLAVQPERPLQAQPGILFGVQASRAFLGRVVRHLARDCGIRQFLVARFFDGLE
jgi:hypothetical protein